MDYRNIPVTGKVNCKLPCISYDNDVPIDTTTND